MKVLVTGATGYIGGAVAAALAAAGHTVRGMVRSAEMDGTEPDGWQPVAGDLRDKGSLMRQGMWADAIVHAANTGGADAAEVDVAATRTLLGALPPAGARFIYTSGAWVLGPGERDERSPTAPPALVAWRASLEREILASPVGAGAVIIRPGIVYGGGGGIPGMVARGEVPVIGDGRQRWPLVHVADLAELYVLALAAPPGSILHGVSATLSMGDLAALCAAAGAAPAAAPLAPAEARARFGDFADALLLDQVVDTRITRALVGWRPRGPSPVAELLGRGVSGRYSAPAAGSGDGQRGDHGRAPAPGVHLEDPVVAGGAA